MLTSLLTTRRFLNKTLASSTAVAAAEQPKLQSDLNAFIACDFDKDMAGSMQMNKSNDC